MFIPNFVQTAKHLFIHIATGLEVERIEAHHIDTGYTFRVTDTNGCITAQTVNLRIMHERLLSRL